MTTVQLPRQKQTLPRMTLAFVSIGWHCRATPSGRALAYSFLGRHLPRKHLPLPHSHPSGAACPRGALRTAMRTGLELISQRTSPQQTQRAQYPLIMEYCVIYIGILNMIYGIFFNQGILGYEAGSSFFFSRLFASAESVPSPNLRANSASEALVGSDMPFSHFTFPSENARCFRPWLLPLEPSSTLDPVRVPVCG